MLLIALGSHSLGGLKLGLFNNDLKVVTSISLLNGRLWREGNRLFAGGPYLTNLLGTLCDLLDDRGLMTSFALEGTKVCTCFITFTAS